MMTDRQILAHDYFKQGYNCAQATLMPFADILELPPDTLMRMAAAFGGGFARTRNICGAVSAIGMVVGLTFHHSGDTSDDKLAVYAATRSITDQFIALNGTLLCGELLKNMKNITADYTPSARTAEYYHTRPCVKFVMDAVGLLEEYLSKNN